MKQADFDEFIESVREAGRILRHEVEPSREFSFTTSAAVRSTPKPPATPNDDEPK